MACGLALVFIAHVQGFRPPAVETHEVVVKDLPAALDATTVAVMTYLHVGEMFLGSHVEQVQALRPGCVVLVDAAFVWIFNITKQSC